MHSVDLLARRVDAEVIRGATVERGGGMDPDEVRVDVPVTRAGQRRRRLRVVALDGDVQRIVVPEDTEAGRRRRGLAVVGLRLEEAVADLGGAPGRFVGAAIDPDLA